MLSGGNLLTGTYHCGNCFAISSVLVGRGRPPRRSVDHIIFRICYVLAPATVQRRGGVKHATGLQASKPRANSKAWRSAVIFAEDNVVMQAPILPFETVCIWT